MASAVRTWSDKALIQELRLVSDTGGPVDYVVGLWYQDQDLFSSQDSFLRGFKRWWDAADLFGDLDFLVTGDRDFIYRRDESFEDRAIYGELTWHVTRPRPPDRRRALVRQRVAQRHVHRRAALRFAVAADPRDLSVQRG